MLWICWLVCTWKYFDFLKRFYLMYVAAISLTCFINKSLIESGRTFVIWTHSKQLETGCNIWSPSFASQQNKFNNAVVSYYRMVLCLAFFHFQIREQHGYCSHKTLSMWDIFPGKLVTPFFFKQYFKSIHDITKRISGHRNVKIYFRNIDDLGITGYLTFLRCKRFPFVIFINYTCPTSLKTTELLEA